MAQATRKDIWDRNLESVRHFAATNKRWPSTMSDNETEKKLAQWWSRQKYLLNKSATEPNCLSDERVALLKGFIDGNSFLERNGVWNTNYEKISNKFKTDGKIGNLNSGNEEDQKVIRWWNQQKTFAKKFKSDPNNPVGGMSQERYNKVVSLMTAMGIEFRETVNTVVNNDPVSDTVKE